MSNLNSEKRIEEFIKSKSQQDKQRLLNECQKWVNDDPDEFRQFLVSNRAVTYAIYIALNEFKAKQAHDRKGNTSHIGMKPPTLNTNYSQPFYTQYQQQPQQQEPYGQVYNYQQNPNMYPPQGYPPQGYPPQGYPQYGEQNYQQYPPQGYPPQGYPPQGYPQYGEQNYQQYPPQYQQYGQQPPRQ